MSSYLQLSVANLANLIAQLRELERLRLRVQRAEARVVNERLGTRRSRASRQRSRGLHREGKETRGQRSLDDVE
jgi:hypothetical protein